MVNSTVQRSVHFSCVRRKMLRRRTLRKMPRTTKQGKVRIKRRRGQNELHSPVLKMLQVWQVAKAKQTAMLSQCLQPRPLRHRTKPWRLSSRKQTRSVVWADLPLPSVSSDHAPPINFIAQEHARVWLQSSVPPGLAPARSLLVPQMAAKRARTVSIPSKARRAPRLGR